jgi:CheY-like chemotaxis protein
MSDILSPSTDPKLNVYFIDDSATMREVVKIAFRRENFNVVTCADMASAVAQFELTAPNAVISDVIMPDKDGYQLCQFIKQHPQFGGIPVLLMSGVVNKEVAEKANDVRADELIRKPFHPQDLVDRVKKLLNLTGTSPAPALVTAAPGNPLGRLFEGAGGPLFPTPPAMASSLPPASAPANATRPAPAGVHSPGRTPTGSSPDRAKLRSEVRRLESLVKKLQSELASEREYSATLEEQLRSVGTAE